MAADALPLTDSLLDAVERVFKATPFYVEKELW